MNRKDFLKYSGSLSLLVLTSGGVISFLGSCMKKKMKKVSELKVRPGDFTTQIPFPEIMTGASFALTAARNTESILKDKKTYAYGYAGGILGPIIKVNTGQTISINFANNLEEDTNIHWHGLIIPENMDGHPKYSIGPGSSFNYQFTINQRAGTYWFHPHPHLKTARQVFKGLAGLFIVTDTEETGLNLPSGEYEIPLIIQDKRFYSDGSINYSPDDMDVMSGYFGDYICVNGRWSVFHNVKTKIYRLRVLNGSNARVYNLSFSNGIDFNIIGSDGGLLGSTQTVSSIILSPGERLDLLINLSSLPVNSEFFLQNNSFNGGETQGKESFNIMKFKVNEQVTETYTIPTTLSAFSAIPSSLSLKTRSFDIANKHMSMSGNMDMGSSASIHNIGGKSFSMERIDETVAAGTTEIWEFDNSQGEDLHPMHLHGIHFQVLSRTGGRGIVLPHEAGWKDTVLCMAGEKVKIIMTFPNNPGIFVFHCHNLEHEDSGMMLNYKIV